ncbi:hypothetical protein ASF70_15990 [Rhizobium sp. Leaf321]|uniref:hypothetical protein n=1 Tax=Rhizobium sp. Leaf321 TaxID=1736335 RepID=UPI000714A2AB|nr:hypothetical protein [Rhizobium sp. Leaf321]KQQ72964.1 hypothetical protein ASF70_15990 [Rhizobium sp. Leaf321]
MTEQKRQPITPLTLTEDQQNAIRSFAARMEASPEAVLRRAIGSYCANFSGERVASEDDTTNVTIFGGQP